MNCERLERFRQLAYQLLGKAKDATFELRDAVLTTRNASCLADFSLSPLFRRKWPSIYEALQDSRPQREKLMRLYLQQIPQQEYLVLAIDHTAWARPDAKTLKDRTYVLDSEYGNASWVLATAELEADSLMRVRSNLCLWSAPPPYSGRGRPRKHGQKFKLNDSSTWGWSGGEKKCLLLKRFGRSTYVASVLTTGIV